MSKGTLARAVIVGRMGNAIEVKTIGGSTRVANLSLAVSQGYGDKQTTSWFNVQVFGDKRIDALSNYTDKGTKLFVEGELRIRKYQKDGTDRYATEVVVGYDGVVEILSSKDEQAASGEGSRGQSAAKPQPAFDSDIDDDVPF